MRGFWFLMAVMVLLVACGAPPTAVPTATPAPEVVARRAALAFQQITTFHFALEQRGTRVTVDPGQTIAFLSAEGDFVAPDRVRATVKLAAGNLISEAEIVTIGDQGWMTNLFTGRWERLPAGWGLDPVALFHPETGIAHLLTAGLRGVELVGPLAAEGLAGQNWLLTGKAEPAQLEAMSGGLIPSAPADVEVWIDPETHLIARVRLVLPESDPSEPTEWVLTLSRFGQEVTIEPPL
jgi:hypothetical protein